MTRLDADPAPTQPESSYLATGVRFLLGGLVTAVFSGSLAALASHASLTEVLTTGMIVPSFTWVVQLSASAAILPAVARRRYWADLGAICLLGSVALLPAAVVNLTASAPPWWLSAANVVASVVLMAGELFRRAKVARLPAAWPASWCLTIATNMAIFYSVSRHWW